MNQMARQLEERIATVTRQRDEHAALLACMTEGVIAVDSGNRLIKANEAAAELFDLDVPDCYGRNIVELVRKTRQHEDTYLGASPRGSLGLLRASQAHACLQGRTYVIPDDVKAVAAPVLGHRLILAPGAHLRDMDETKAMAELLEQVIAPGGAFSPE